MRRVLLVMPSFFNYPDVIVQELASMGVECDRVNDRPSDSTFVKIAVRLNDKALPRMVERHCASIESLVEANDYDVILVISGQSLSLRQEHLERLRKAAPRPEFVLYQWDSLANYPRIVDLLHLFDRAYTFDPHDAKKFGISFLPLFYHRGYEAIGDSGAQDYPVDFSFVGTAHPAKHEFVMRFMKESGVDQSRCELYEYLPSPLVYVRHRLMETSFHGSLPSDFNYKPLSALETEKLIARSKAVLDAPQANQTGLTIRTIECLGARRKMVTTNMAVKSYDFYRPENVYVWNGGRIDRAHPFFTMPWVDPAPGIRESYSLRSWLRTILGNGLVEVDKEITR